MLGVEIAGLENMGPKWMGGKCRTGKCENKFMGWKRQDKMYEKPSTLWSYHLRQEQTAISF
jgi:hypothetical protein